MISRLLTLLATFSLLAAGLVLAPAISTSVAFESGSSSFQVKPVDQAVVCPGPLYRSGGSSGTSLGDFSRLETANLTATAKSNGLIEIDQLAKPSTKDIELGGERVFDSRGVFDATELRNTQTAKDSAQGSRVLTGSTFQIAKTESMRGLAAASCQQPSNEIWLVGGSTASAREALLILTNMTPIDATADLRIYSDLGEIEVSGLAGISVVARSTTVLSLASFAPGVSVLAVSIQSQGAKLAGWIQQRAVQGTSAVGVDLISPTAVHSNQIAIPGLVIRGSGVINRALLAQDSSDAGHALRVFAPEGASITVQVISSDAEVFGAVFTALIEAGTVSDLPIDELGDGDYTVFVSSDQPIYAGLKVARGNPGGTPRLDFAWLSPAEPFTSERAVSIPEIGAPVLVIGNFAETNSQARITNLRTGQSQTVLIPALGTASLEISDSVAISSEQEIYASVILLAEGQISDLQITDPINIGAEVRVRFR